MTQRKCGTCRYFEEGGIAASGWCRHPLRQDLQHLVLVRKSELACRQGWGKDLWEPRTGDQADSAADAAPSPATRAVPVAGIPAGEDRVVDGHTVPVPRARPRPAVAGAGLDENRRPSGVPPAERPAAALGPVEPVRDAGRQEPAERFEAGRWGRRLPDPDPAEAPELPPLQSNRLTTLRDRLPPLWQEPETPAPADRRGREEAAPRGDLARGAARREERPPAARPRTERPEPEPPVGPPETVGRDRIDRTGAAGVGASAARSGTTEPFELPPLGQAEPAAVIDEVEPAAEAPGAAVGNERLAAIPRCCRTCRDFRPADGAERGWCNNRYAFEHRRMVQADELACESTIGTWWTPSDDWWLQRADISHHGRPTPIVDAFLRKLLEERVSGRR